MVKPCCVCQFSHHGKNVRSHGNEMQAIYCIITAWFVLFYLQTAYPSRTKHCRLCDCCYKGLDHHCLFLMTCIAINNHGAFLAMIFSVFIAQFSYVRGALICKLNSHWSSFYLMIIYENCFVINSWTFIDFWSISQSHSEMSYLVCSILGLFNTWFE